MEICPFCQQPATFIHVHSHYQCSVCGTNAIPCCNGETACDEGYHERPQTTTPATPKGSYIPVPGSAES